MLGSDRSISKGFTSNPYVNGILWSGARLPRNQITYSFDNQGSNNWGTVGVAAVEAALSRWESVADIEFVRVANNNNYADLRMKLEDSSYFANGSANSISLGEFNPPGELNQGEGVFNADQLGNSNFSLKPGEEGFKVLLHEIGHGLGLGHPHDTSRGLSTTFSGIPNHDADNKGLFNLNQGVWTTMSYNSGFNGRGFESSPMAFDIAAVQHLYGANNSYAAGNDTYRLSDSDGYTAIWDTGGIDTISAIRLGSGVDAKIDLRAAPLTGANAGGYISGAENINAGLTIANGVEIENATGGLYNDTLTGNKLDNTLNGQGGNDFLFGLGGSDTLLGGYGKDILLGTNPTSSTSGLREYDVLTGGGSQDVFALGDRNGAFYQGDGFATITDFDRSEGDKIQVFGSSSDYTFTDSLGGIEVKYQGDLIGYVQNTTNINFVLDLDYL